MKNIFFTDESMKINWFNSEKYVFSDESVKRQITDSISENLTDSDLESGSFKIYWIVINSQNDGLSLLTTYAGDN